jgi:4-hydroxy-tetrahydrodipicolinate reductase
MIRVLVSGAAGRMGREVLAAVTAADGMEVVGAIDPGADVVELPSGAGSVDCGSDLAEAISAHKPDVVVDFTRPDTVEANIRTALASRVDCVVGTTGLSEDSLRELAREAPAGTCLFVAPNFAIGAVLAMRFAKQAARFMPHAEVIELHHALRNRYAYRSAHRRIATTRAERARP